MPLFGTRGAASVTGFGGLAKLGYLLRNSLRFRRANGAYLSRTPGVAGNRKAWTWSGWVKLGSLGVARQIFGAGSGSTQAALVFEAGDTLFAFSDNASGTALRTSQLFRDPAAWYHIVWAENTTEGTASNRSKLYVNGVQVTAFSYEQYPTVDTTGAINNTGTHYISSYDGSNWLFDGYLAEVHFVNAQALTPSSFGKTDPVTGQWIPKKYEGTYGTNGFYLPFTNTSSTSTLVADSSGNGNNWTPNNISVTAGVTYDSMTDVPTLTSATTSNYATLNPLLYAPSYGYRDLTNGNLTTIGTSGTNNGNDYSTQAIKTGMWYAEFTCTVGTTSTYPQVGIISVASAGTGTGQVGYVANSAAYFADGTKQINNSQTSYGNSFTTNDVIGVAVDADNGAIYFGKQTGGTGSIVWQNSGVPTSGASKTGAAWTWTGGSIEFFFSTAVYTTSNGWHVNFGQRPFSSTPPSGFKALNTFNLP